MEIQLAGILNLTPDSFSDGGSYPTPQAAIEWAKSMVAQGATIIDAGAESTRPDHTPITAAEELNRLSPVLPRLTALSAKISVDTYKCEVAEYALSCGAHIINDVYGYKKDKNIAEITARYGAGCILTHNSGISQRVNETTPEPEFIKGVLADLLESIEIAKKAGVKKIILDPGIGFYKSSAQNWLLFNNLTKIRELGYEVMLALSRKRMVKEQLANPTQESLDDLTAKLTVQGAQNGATYHRVHNIAATKKALQEANMINS